MADYRLYVREKTTTTRYPLGKDAETFTDTRLIFEIAPVFPADPAPGDIIAEKIDNGRRTRRFLVQRFELHYQRTNDGPWRGSAPVAKGTAVKADGQMGVAEGYYSWWSHSVVPMPNALAALAKAYDQEFGVTR